MAAGSSGGIQRDSISSELSSAHDHTNEFRNLLDHFGETDGLRVIRPERKKAGLHPKKWLKYDRSGHASMVKAEKGALMNSLGLQPRDLRLLEPQVSGGYPSALLTREKAIVVNLEAVKCICTPDYVLVFNPEDKSVVPFVERLHTWFKPPAPRAPPPQPLSAVGKKGKGGGGGGGGGGAKGLGAGLRPLSERLKSGLTSSFSTPNLKSLARDSTGYASDSGADVANGGRAPGQPPAPASDASGPAGHPGGGSASDFEQPDGPGGVPGGDGEGGAGGEVLMTDEDTPFELRALEVVLDFVSDHLEAVAADLEIAAHPALETLTRQITTTNLERVRKIKNKLVRLTTRVETVRALLEGLLDDDSDMRDMNLTAKRAREAAERERELEMEALLAEEVALAQEQAAARAAAASPAIIRWHATATTPSGAGADGDAGGGGHAGVGVGVGDGGSGLNPRGPQHQQEQQQQQTPGGGGALGQRPGHAKPGRGTPMELRHMHSKANDSDDEDDEVEEVEMVLEPYFMRLDNTFNKLHSLTEFIDDAEDYINIELDSKRNQLIKIDLLLTSVTFAFGIISAVTSLFGMNLGNARWLEDTSSYWGFCTASATTSAIAVLVVLMVVLYMRKKKILHIY